MPKLTLAPPKEPFRRDTISLRTVVKYDPMAPRPTTPIFVGKYVVARRPLHGSIYTLYLILDGEHVAATTISYPSEDDCATAIKRFRNAARSLTADVITKAKRRKPRALRIKEAA